MENRERYRVLKQEAYKNRVRNKAIEAIATIKKAAYDGKDSIKVKYDDSKFASDVIKIIEDTYEEFTLEHGIIEGYYYLQISWK